MDQSAIQHIQAMALAGVATTLLDKTSTPTVLVPDGFKIESLEKFEARPSRHEEHFKTQYLSEFFSYSKKHDTGGFTAFIDEQAMQANAIFDRSEPTMPQWQKHRATLKPVHTPALAALLLTNDRPFKQDDLIDFVTDWAENIVFYDGETALDFADGLSRLRKLRVNTNKTAESNRGDFKAQASALETIEIDAAGAPLPSHFVFTTEPYMEFQTRAYTAHLRAIGSEDKVALRYRLMGLPAIEQDIANEFKAKIGEALTSATIHIGTI